MLQTGRLNPQECQWKVLLNTGDPFDVSEAQVCPYCKMLSPRSTSPNDKRLLYQIKMAENTARAVLFIIGRGRARKKSGHGRPSPPQSGVRPWTMGAHGLSDTAPLAVHLATIPGQLIL